MVSIILQQKQERDNKISKIEEILKKNPVIDMRDFIIETMNVFDCSERKAKEYIKVAKWRIENANSTVSSV